MRLLIPIIFLVLTAWFSLGSGSGELPVGWRARVSAEDIDRGAARPVMGDPPRISMAGFEMACDECHGIFDSGSENGAPRKQHLEITLEHGLNARCTNCHARENRNRLVLPGEREIPYAEVVQLCASCHGPTFRDWSAGTHGKARGSWDMASPERELFLCTECHDPHHPAFRPMRPLPAPRTLRMRATERDEGHVGQHEHNPLRPHRGNRGGEAGEPESPGEHP